jgi:ubiquinone/menaquinone biosynthesis C-methylase UbiE
MDPEASIINYYTERAAHYERIYRKREWQHDLQLLRSYVTHTFANNRVLEVACGTGYWTEVLSHSAALIIATDVSEKVLAVARSKHLDIRKVIFRREDAYNLPNFPQPFEAAFSAFWWSHIPRIKLRNFLYGLHRVMAPGSRVVFIDNLYVKGVNAPISRIDSRGDTYQTRRLDDGSTYEVLKNFPSESELQAALKDLASDIHIHYLQYDWILSYVPRTCNG